MALENGYGWSESVYSGQTLSWDDADSIRNRLRYPYMVALGKAIKNRVEFILSVYDIDISDSRLRWSFEYNPTSPPSRSSATSGFANDIYGGKIAMASHAESVHDDVTSMIPFFYRYTGSAWQTWTESSVLSAIGDASRVTPGLPVAEWIYQQKRIAEQMLWPTPERHLVIAISDGISGTPTYSDFTRWVSDKSSFSDEVSAAHTGWDAVLFVVDGTLDSMHPDVGTYGADAAIPAEIECHEVSSISSSDLQTEFESCAASGRVGNVYIHVDPNIAYVSTKNEILAAVESFCVWVRDNYSPTVRIRANTFSSSFYYEWLYAMYLGMFSTRAFHELYWVDAQPYLIDYP